MARAVKLLVPIALLAACSSSAEPGASTPEPVAVTAGTEVQPEGGEPTGTTRPAEATTDPSSWTVIWKVRLERADGTQEHWDLGHEPFATNAGSWVCRLGRVSVAHSVSIVNGRVRSQAEEVREIDCTRGNKREHGSAHCGWSVGFGAGGGGVPPYDEAELALDEGSDRHRLTLRCEVDTSGTAL